MVRQIHIHMPRREHLEVSNLFDTSTVVQSCSSSHLFITEITYTVKATFENLISQTSEVKKSKACSQALFKNSIT